MMIWSRLKVVFCWVIAMAMAVPAWASDYTMTITQPTWGQPFTEGTPCTVSGTMSWVEMWPTEGIPDVTIKVVDDTTGDIAFSWWGPVTGYGWYSGSFSHAGCTLGSPGSSTIKVYAYDGMDYMGIMTSVTVTVNPMPMPPP